MAILPLFLWQWIPIPVFICLQEADAAVLAGVTEVYEQGDTRWARFSVLETLKGPLAHGDTFSLQFASRNTEGIWTSVFYPEPVYFKEPGGGETSVLLLSAIPDGYTLYQYYPYALLTPPADDPGFTYQLRALAEFDTLAPGYGSHQGLPGTRAQIVPGIRPVSRQVS